MWCENGVFVPDDWTKIVFSPVVWVRFPHMLLAAYLTGAFCVAATGAWYLLRNEYHAEAHIMLRMGLFLAAVLVPIQILFGHLNGDYVHDDQPAKFAAIEGRWHDEQPAGEVLIAIPDPAAETNHYEIKIPVLGSLIGSMSFTSKEVGLTDFPPQDRPPVLIPFFTFRIMVGCGLIMLALAWLGSYLSLKGRIERRTGFCSGSIFLSFPLPFIAILTGWFTAEVGRQPWVVYGVLRTADAMTPFLTAREAAVSLVVFCAVYAFIFAFGIFYIYRLLRAGPAGYLLMPPSAAVPNRPMSVVASRTSRRHASHRRGRIAMVMFWVTLLAVSILLYVLLDGFDLGVGMLFGLTRGETRRRAMMSAVAPIWDGNETWLVVTGVVLWGAFPVVYATLLSAFYLPLLVMLAGLILRGVAFEYRNKTERLRWIWDVSFAGGSFVGGIHPRLDGRCPRRGPADGQWPICRRRVRLVQSVRGALRRRPVSRLCAARRLLAGQEMRRRRPRGGLSPDPLSVGRAACFSDRRLRLRARRTLRGHGPMGRAAIFVCLSRRSAPWPRSCWPSAFDRRRDDVPFLHGHPDLRVRPSAHWRSRSGRT